MPEHAEVRVAATQLDRIAHGSSLRTLTITHPRTTRHQPVEAFARFPGHVVDGVTAIGKWIVVAFAELDETLAIHLRMSGQLRRAAPGTPHPDRHVHAVFTLDSPDGDSVEIWFRDPRTFGELRVFSTGLVPSAPDLFDDAVSAATLAAAARTRTIAVKAFLLDQQAAVAGIGSYLADEALHEVGMDPRRPAWAVRLAQWDEILVAARRIAEASFHVGGVTLADEGWIDLDGNLGRYGDELRVHAREHCAACGAPTRTAELSGRRARWCPACQPRRRLPRRRGT